MFGHWISSPALILCLNGRCLFRGEVSDEKIMAQEAEELDR